MCFLSFAYLHKVQHLWPENKQPDPVDRYPNCTYHKKGRKETHGFNYEGKTPDTEKDVTVRKGETVKIFGRDMTWETNHSFYKGTFRDKIKHMWWVPLKYQDKWVVVSSLLDLTMRRLFLLHYLFSSPLFLVWEKS